MLIVRLILQNFRNFETASFAFAPGINSIWGGNGSGKSNVLEAIYLAGAGRPKKGGRDGELIRFGEPVARVEVRIQKRRSEMILESTLERIENFSARKTLKINHQPVRKLSDLVGQVKVVFFSPQDQAVVQGEPSFRRRFLDMALSQLSPSYLHALQQYQGIREQRNTLLRRPHSPSERVPWNIQLIDFGSQVLLKRLQTLPLLAARAEETHRELSEGESLSLFYQSSFPVDPSNTLDEIKGRFEKALEGVAWEESERGMTLVGPHRDDLRILLDRIDARLFSSEGQQKTAALALRLAEGKLFAEAEGEAPLYLLDDCFSELDQKRQEAIIQNIQPQAQSIVTLTQPPHQSLAQSNAIELEPRQERREPVSSL